MSQLDFYLETIQPELINTARLFGMEGELERIRMDAREDGDQYRIAFTLGDETASRSAAVPSDPDPRIQELHRKRAARRTCKQALYDLCRKISGIRPPWGSLTGVRPTHLMLEALAEGLTPVEAVRRLEEAFDVSPEKARLLAETAAVQRELPPPGDEWMDVYIGIPFCTTRCLYCSFSSGEIGNGRLVGPYLDALERELRAGAEILAESGRGLRAVYVGGGTPTALPEADFRRLLDLMTDCFPNAAEYTVEAGRPDTLTRDKLRAIREAGVRRISINPQTMNDRTLRIIGRAHTAAQVREAYALAREEGIGHINMDVIAGLPGEELADFARTMEEAERLRPESLTVHTLAIKRSSPWGEMNTAARKGLGEAPRLPSGETAEGMVRLGRTTAERMGMRPYYLYKQKYMAGNLENTGYALPGHECLYNVDIMEETSHILAFGAGGISKRVYPEEGHIGRAPNVSSIETYLARVEEMIRRKRELFLSDAPAGGEEGRKPEEKPCPEPERKKSAGEAERKPGRDGEEPYQLRSARYLAADVLRRSLREGDRAVDATMGNGHDTETLCRLVGPTGRIYAFDVQEQAVEKTRERLGQAGLLDRAELFHLGHEHLAERVTGPVQAVVFNLGWLPGGNHQITTRTETTLRAVDQALELLGPGGVLVICAYPGHAEGDRERGALEARLAMLPPQRFNVLRQSFLNAGAGAPECLVIQKSEA